MQAFLLASVRDFWGVEAVGVRFGVHLMHTEVMLCLWCQAHPGSLPLRTWRKGSTLRLRQGCRCFVLTEPPNHFHLSSGLPWHVPLACHDFQLLHSEVTSEKLLVLLPPAPFSFPVIAVDCWQSFWHVHLISLWQADGSMGELWINSKSSKLEIGIALLSTILVSWLPLQPEESKRLIMSYVSSAPLLVWI